MHCRTPHHSVTHLFLSHCGLSDRDGSLILNALVDAAASSSGSCSSSGDRSSTCTSSGCGAHRSSAGVRQRAAQSWVLLDLGYNALEGGAALCAGALVAAEACMAAAAASTGSASGSSEPEVPDFYLSSRNGQGVDGMHCQLGSDLTSSTSSNKRLVLDGNPLGASGVRILMRAIAAQPAVAISTSCSPALGSSASARPGAMARVGSAPAGASGQQDSATAAFFLPAQGGRDGRMAEDCRCLPGLHVSVGKVSLLGKEKGFRASMRAAEAAQAFTTQVGTNRLVGASCITNTAPALTWRGVRNVHRLFYHKILTRSWVPGRA